MSDHDPGLPADNFIELNDPEVTAGELLARVRARLAERPEAHAPLPPFPDYNLDEGAPPVPAGIPYRFALYYHLQRANDLYPAAASDPVLAPSPAGRVPLLGRLWALIREQAHSLVLFYVNRSLAHQTAVHRHLVGALNELVRQNEEQQRTIQQLQARLRALEGDDAE